jgi:hypothetical protein
VQASDGSANVRSGPGSNNAVVIRKDNGEKLVLGNGASVKATSANGGWYSIELRLGGVDYGEAKGIPAWVSSTLLSCS